MAIGSSSKNTPLIVEKLGIGKFFDAIVDGNQISHSKPDPEVFLLAAEKLHQKPGDCLVVEDAEAGVKAASMGAFRWLESGQQKIARTSIIRFYR